MIRPRFAVLSRFPAALLAGSILLLSCAQERPEFREGDLIFQRSESSQSDALELALQSPFTHMGVLLEKNGALQVYEAVGPVKTTPLETWIAGGRGRRYVVKRLRDADRILTDEAVARLREAATSYDGKPYDLYFEWSDDRIYCSELVWKAYQEALDLEIGRRRPLGDFELTDPLVRAKLRERFGDSIPLNEPVISPSDMHASDKLITVYDTGGWGN